MNLNENDHWNGELKLMDYGMANNGTGYGGTLGFSSPEQWCQGLQNNRTDCFALGKVLVLTLFEWKVI